MRYLCLVHFDPAAIDAMTEQERVALDIASLGYNDELAQRGHLVATEALQYPESAAIVRVRAGETIVTDGPFAESKEQLAGFILVEARDLNEAVSLAAGIPIAKFGTIEVRPIYIIPRHGT
jgi:hypothetical protein